MDSNDPFLRWLNRMPMSQTPLEKALDKFDPDWQMQCGEDLNDFDREFLASCNVSWEYNNDEREERLKND